MAKYHKDYERRLERFWETCKGGFAHIEGKQSKVPDIEKWKQGLGNNFGLGDVEKIFEGKTVIDYGLGSGRLGILLSQVGIKKYIGMDIAERQLKVARKQLSDYPNCEFHLIPIEFADFGADIFMTFACMQHFPSENYLVEFANNLNRSGIDQLFLQYRHADPPSFTKDNPSLACRTNASHLGSMLKNYDLAHASEVKKANYQFTYWVKNGNS